MGSSERCKRCSSFSSFLKAARKRSQKGPEGPEKRKGRKPEGKGPVILLMREVIKEVIVTQPGIGKGKCPSLHSQGAVGGL